MLCHAVSLRVHAMAWCSAVAKLVTRLIVLRAALMNVVCSCIRGSSAAAAAAAAAGHSRLGRKPGPLPMPGDIAHFVASLPSPTEFDVEAAGAPSPLEPAAGTRRAGSFASPVRVT